MPKTLRELQDYLEEEVDLDNLKELKKLESELWYSKEEVKELLKSHRKRKEE